MTVDPGDAELASFSFAFYSCLSIYNARSKLPIDFGSLLQLRVPIIR